ncbi:hypothetical protein FB107DRAFT_277685 [Schizophyllum commune]
MSTPHAFEPFASVLCQKDRLLRSSTRLYTSNLDGDVNDALPLTSTMKSSQLGRDCLPSPCGVVVDKQASFKRKLLFDAQVSVNLASPRSRFWTGHPHPRECREAMNRRPPIKELLSETAKITFNAPPPTYEMKSVTSRETTHRRPASGVIAGYTRVLDRASLAKQRIAAQRATRFGLQDND